MKKIIRTYALKVLKFLHTKSYIMYDDSIIPNSRIRLGGDKFKDDAFYIKSAELEAQRLIDRFSIHKNSIILDIGCGVGRLATGLMRKINDIHYIGLDIDKNSIKWCQKYITSVNSNYNFVHLNIYNERYNPDGEKIDDNFNFNFDNKSIDVVYLYSVFSHMIEDEMKIYLKKILRLLKNNGNLFFTTFVESNVPEISYNPENYIKAACHNPLHVVRYNKDHIFGILKDLGFRINEFSHRTEDNGQSAFYLSKSK